MSIYFRKLAIRVFSIIKYIIVIFSTFFPVRERIVIESFLGNRNDDNITEYIKKIHYNNSIYYVQKKENISEIPRGKRLLKNSLQYIWLMHTSSTIIVNSRLHHSLIKKRKEQTVTQFWHGIPWKKLVFDQVDINFATQDKVSYLQKFSSDVKKWDYLWVPNQYSKEKLTSAFQYKGKYIEKMYPADTKMLYLNKHTEYILNLKKKFNIIDNKKIILYMPTFREDKMISSGKYSYYSNFDINELANKHKSYIFLIRGHYLIFNMNNTFADNVIDVSNYTSVKDLYIMSDVLITDYSSAIYSFSLLKKPIVSIQLDEIEYKKMRGLYPDGINGMNILEIKEKKHLDDLSFEKLENSIPQKGYYGME